MRALPKKHVYNLYLFKDTKDLLEFRNNRTYSIITGLVMCTFFWGIHLGIIDRLPEGTPLKDPLSYAFLMMGGMSLLALFHFVSAYHNMLLRRINRSISYEYHSPGGRMGWKKRFDDFESVQMYKALPQSLPGQKKRQAPIWFFDLVGRDEKRVAIRPRGIKALKAEQEEEAEAFVRKVADFMGIRGEKIESDNRNAEPNKTTHGLLKT